MTRPNPGSTPRAFIAGLLGGLVLLQSCGGEQQPDAPAESAMEAEAATEAGVEVPAYSEEVRTMFTPPEGSTSQARGTLRLLVPTLEMDPAGEMPPRIHVQLAGLEPGEHAWYLFGVPCGVDGDALVPLGVWEGAPDQPEPLDVAEDGMAETEVPVPELFDTRAEAGNYSVRIFSAPSLDEGALVACANL